MLKEKLQFKGKVEILVTGKNGELIEQRSIPNLVVDAGLAYIASRMVEATKGVMSHMALGSGGATVAAGPQTDLIALLGTREAIDSAVIAGDKLEKVEYTCSFEAGDATGAVTEAGIFNALAGGDMLCRTTFPVVNKGPEDTITVIWTISMAPV